MATTTANAPKHRRPRPDRRPSPTLPKRGTHFGFHHLYSACHSGILREEGTVRRRKPANAQRRFRRPCTASGEIARPPLLLRRVAVSAGIPPPTASLEHPRLGSPALHPSNISARAISRSGRLPPLTTNSPTVPRLPLPQPPRHSTIPPTRPPRSQTSRSFPAQSTPPPGTHRTSRLRPTPAHASVSISQIPALRTALRPPFGTIESSTVFDASLYGPPAAEILALAGAGNRPLPLVCPRAGNPNIRQLLRCDSKDVFPGAIHPQAAHAGLWLYCGFFEESHSIAQDLRTPEGSYWHAILHRMEPDAWNSGYWFRRVGSHPVFPLLAAAAQGLGYSTGDKWSAEDFTTDCEAARDSGPADKLQLLEQVQLAEWQLLFDFCARSKNP